MSSSDDSTFGELDGGAPLLADRRMNDSEALMWRVEKDPFLASTFGSVSILDRPLDVARLRRRLAGAVAVVPRLAWRVQPARSDIGPPTWGDDPDFDLGFHVRHVALPAPGSDEQLYELAAQYVADPLDRTRPLWGFLVVDGLSGGRGALVQRMHHSISDGVTALKLSLQYMDLERDATSPVGGEVIVDDGTPPPPPPSSLDSMRSFVHQTFRLPLSIARQVGELLADPASIPKATTAAADSVRAIATQLSEADAARSPLWTERSLRRRMALSTAPFRPVKEAAARLGGTINTAFIAAVADAAGRYHRERDAPVDELRATMAISTRTEGSGSNAFSLARMLVPTAKMPLRERFALVGDAVSAARATSNAAGLEVLATLSSALPTSLLTRVIRAQAQTVDLATSNVRGAPMAVYIAGARLLSTAPLGPLAGVAANITMLSYDGRLDVGVHVDAAAIDEVERFAALIGRSFRTLARLK